MHQEMHSKRLTPYEWETHLSKITLQDTKSLINKTEIQKDSPAAIDYFQKSLNIPLQKQLLSLPTPSTTLDEWTEWASHIDNNYRKMLQIFGRTPNNKKEEPKRHWHFQKRELDPNAMDVNTMTVKKCEEAMKKGLCFECGKPGHLNRDCPDKKKAIYACQTPSKKMTPKELYAHIQSITKEMSETEKDEFYKEAEEEGC